jgi:acetyl esterase/lipase
MSSSASTLHLVDPELTAALETFPEILLSKEALASTREAQKLYMASLPKPENSGVTIEEKKIPGLDGAEVGVMIYNPQKAARLLPAVLHMHGSGYVLGNAEMMDIAKHGTGCAVAMRGGVGRLPAGARCAFSRTGE